MIDMRECTRKGVCPRMGCVGPRDERLMGVWAWMGAPGPWRGVTSWLSVGSRRGVTHPRDMMFHTSDPWSPYKSKGAQPKEGIEHFGKRFGEQV
jgi:hypothetical protein